MMKNICSLLLLIGLVSCAHNSQDKSEQLTSIQILDRNGFSETISLRDRLAVYEKTDFLTAQPYQKVVRVFGKVSHGNTFSKITTYHPNGQLWKYLECVNGRANGQYHEWHANGQLKITATVIEGTADVSQLGQMSWLFNNISEVYDEHGHCIAKMPYNKGVLDGLSCYYFPSGEIEKEIPYVNNEIHGTVRSFNTAGDCLELIPYSFGEKDGLSMTYWAPGQLKAEELYEKGLLINARYLDSNGKIIAKVENGFGLQALFEENYLKTLIEHQNGKVEGKVQTFNSDGCLVNLYSIKDEMKSGEEWEYYPIHDGKEHPKLFLEWDQDSIHGVTKTWYENGILESQREMHNNKKHGLSFAWYKEGDLMLMEEYENDLLVKGSYYKNWEKTPISKVDNGKGVATLYDKDGRVIRKVDYEKGIPLNEP